MKIKAFSGVLLLSFVSCATPGTDPRPSVPVQSPPSQLPSTTMTSKEISPMEAVLAAAERPEGITGVFRMKVQGTGRKDGWLYLNSEEDYRDQRCLVIGLPPKVAKELEQQLGSDPVVAMNGKTIRITGTAQRTTIWFFSNGVRTDKYYYQTQVRLADMSQIRIVP